MIKIPGELIDICVDFIKNNDLGPVELFSDIKKEYNQLEKERLDHLLDICTKIINSEISLTVIDAEIKEYLKIDDSLVKIISEEIKNFLGSYKEQPETENENLSSKKIIDKKNIFSVVIDKKN